MHVTFGGCIWLVHRWSHRPKLRIFLTLSHHMVERTRVMEHWLHNRNLMSRSLTRPWIKMINFGPQFLCSSMVYFKQTDWTEDEPSCSVCLVNSNVRDSVLSQCQFATKTHVYLQCGLFDLNQIQYRNHHHAPSDQLIHCRTSHLVQSSKLKK